MNHTTFNTTISNCMSTLFSINLTNISLDLRTVLIVRIVVNALTCPLIIVLNILVMVAVKTKRQLRTKFNIALVCSSTADFVVTWTSRLTSLCLLERKAYFPDIRFCTLTDLSKTVTSMCLISTERYAGIKVCIRDQDH